MKAVRYSREIGPMPAQSPRAMRKRNAVIEACMCPECRALSPARQAQWERDRKRRAAKGEG